MVYFGSPNIALFNGNRTIWVYDQILLIGDPNFCLKRIDFPSSKLIPGCCMFGIMVQSSGYIVCEFHEN